MNRRRISDTRERILVVAEKHFSEKGYDLTRVDEVAKEAGINKALIYYYFKSKEEILDVILSKFFEESMALKEKYSPILSFPQRRENGNGKDLENEKVLEALTDFFERNKDVLNILYMQTLKSKSKMHLFEFLDKNIQRSLDIIKDRYGKIPRNELQLYLQTFYMGFIPVIAFVLFNEKFCSYHDIDPEVAKKNFIHLFYQEYLLDTTTRLFK